MNKAKVKAPPTPIGWVAITYVRPGGVYLWVLGGYLMGYQTDTGVTGYHFTTTTDRVGYGALLIAVLVCVLIWIVRKLE